MRNKIIKFILLILSIYNISFADDIYFSPGIEKELIDKINKSKEEIYIQMYLFTNKDIANALINCHNNVYIILDKINLTYKYSMLNLLKKYDHIHIFIDDKHSINHNKVIIFNLSEVCTGSYNFTKSAEKRNAENFMCICNEMACSIYINDFESHKKHSIKIKDK